MKKKGQSAVAGIIILIAIFFFFYVYLMPMSEKCKLMPDIRECQQQTQEEQRIKSRILADIQPVTLLEESPGFLQIQEKYAVYSVRPVDIYRKEEVEIATILEKEEVSEDWFYSIDKKGVFSIHNESEGVRLFIYVSKGSGNLEIDINPDAKFLIKESDLNKDMPLEIYIPAEKLDSLNIARLSVSAPLTPFQKNVYEIEKITVKEIYRITDDSFEHKIDVRERLEQLNKAYLYFKPYCITQEKLTVTFNSKEIKDETLCNEQLADVTGFVLESNILTFTTKGNYFVFPVKLHLKFKKMNNTIYYFDIEGKEYEQIEKGIALVMLTMDFDSTESKKIDVYINKRLLEIDTNNIDYNTRINDFIKEGINTLELSARTDTSVNKLKVHIK